MFFLYYYRWKYGNYVITILFYEGFKCVQNVFCLSLLIHYIKICLMYCCSADGCFSLTVLFYFIILFH